MIREDIIKELDKKGETRLGNIEAIKNGPTAEVLKIKILHNMVTEGVLTESKDKYGISNYEINDSYEH